MYNDRYVVKVGTKLSKLQHIYFVKAIVNKRISNNNKI